MNLPAKIVVVRDGRDMFARSAKVRENNPRSKKRVPLSQPHINILC